MKRACDVVDSRREEIARLVAGLMERDTLDADEIREAFAVEDEQAAA